MRKGLAAGLCVFWLGYVMALAHWPFAGLTKISGAVVLLAHALRLVRADTSPYRVQALLSLSVATLHLYFLFRFQFWPGSTAIGILAIVSTLVAIGMTFAAKPIPQALFALACVFAVLGIVINFTRAYELHRHKWYEAALPDRASSYWYKQSWFLMGAGLREESLAAMDSAISDASDSLLIHELQERREQILDGTWGAYDEPERMY